jgi:hypothetical protein
VLKRILLLVVLASVLSSCGTANEDKEIEVAIEKACKTVININGGVSVSGGAGGAFAELARLDARYLPLLISFSDWWQEHIVYGVSGPAKYLPFPDALVDFCKA